MKPLRRPLAALALAGLFAIGACHDDLAPTVDAALADTADTQAAPDTAPPQDTATATDTAAADTAPPADTTPLPGELGAPCTDAAECNGSWCLPARDGSVCTKSCTDACPAGWSCRQHLGVLPDVAFVCMPPAPTFCLPCQANADCLPPYDATPHACVRQGDTGAFCGAVCATDADCPADAFCSAVLDVAGQATRQCVPTAGTCPCSAPAIAAAASTTCSRSNAFGACTGTRTCTAQGLTPCDALAPRADLCNAVDDNCDGHTDEAFAPTPCAQDNAFGSCAGLTTCGPDGLRCDAPTPAAERCGDGLDQDCDGLVDEEGAADCRPHWTDADGDGVGAGPSRCLCAPDGAFSATAGGDCDDGARKVYPGADERCDGAGVDDDCDGQTDEPPALGCVTYHADADADGFGAATDGACLCAPAAPYTARDALDCDDTRAQANPARPETCNGADDDCDGLSDEEGAAGCTLFFEDRDGDTFGDPARFRCLCAPAAPFTAAAGGDCDDTPGAGAARHPGRAESCDGADNDCDGLVDEAGAAGCALFARDTDGDTFGLQGDVLCLCGAGAVPGYTALRDGDCDDDEPLAHPDAVETCDTTDNDCDGLVDEADATGCATYHADRDRDGHGVAEARCLCAPTLPFTAASTDDCDDANPFVRPTGAEVCNGLDDDCDLVVDEGVTGQCSPFYRDADHDGWGNSGEAQCLCAPSGEHTATRPGDCDDGRADVFPLAQELCNGGRDDDCDGQADEDGALGCVVYHLDGDGDGVGRAGDSRCLCAPDSAGHYTAFVPGDCDDTDATIRPGALEGCNGRDDDCDTLTDERGATGCVAFLRDTDQDGFGLASDVECWCEATGAYSASEAGDCDDLDADVHPAQAETCDGKDNDCNGIADDPDISGCTRYYRDADGDTHGATGDSACLCAPLGTLTAARAGDCNDLLGTTYPGAPERCNGGDDDCDGQTDEAGATGCLPFLEDVDGDGFGSGAAPACLCLPGPVYRATLGGDCDDALDSVNPGAPERCGGGDDDCDGDTDEDGAAGCSLRHRDGDRDGYGADGASRCLCAPGAPWDATLAGDCADADPAVRPGATEACANGRDDDCDGFVDEAGASGCATLHLDADGDGAGVSGTSLCLCGPQGAYSAATAGDCDDGDALRTPGRAEVCDGRDNDCAGGVDDPGASGCATLWSDADGDSWGVDGSALCLCLPEDDFTALRGGDCDDDLGSVRPDAAEVCDSRDNDCDGVVDEGCGLPTAHWPTAMQNARRTGHALAWQGPTTAALRWKKKLSSTPFANSPVVDEAGDVVILLGDTVFKLRPSDGATLWTHTLPAPAFARAAPTARVGGTLVVPTGNAVALLARDGALLWRTDFGGSNSDLVVGNPLVDPTGKIYVISNTHARRLDESGAVLWATPIVNTATHPADPGLGPDGRLYFATADRVYAMTPAGQVNWTWSVAAKPPGASVTLTEVARILVPAGDTLYLLADGQTQALVVDTLAFGGALVKAPAALYSDGWQCCNPAEFALASPEGVSGLRHLKANFDLAWSVALPKRAGPSAPPVFDRDGDIYVGSNSGSPSTNALFYAKRRSDGATLWSYRADSPDIDGSAAVTSGVVLFGDGSGTIHCLGGAP